MSDSKFVYQAVNIESAEHQLEILEEKWGKKYPHVLRSWRKNWNTYLDILCLARPSGE